MGNWSRNRTQRSPRKDSMDCFACERIQQIRRGENPHFFAELAESYAVLADEQAYRGWCILLLKDHHEHLAGLPLDRQSRLWNDVARVASAVTRELKPVRINYECLGNLLHHIHWHVIPRHADDPDPTKPVWGWPEEQLKGTMTEAEQGELVKQLRAKLAPGA